MLVASFLVYLWYSARPSRSIDSIAVLPFINASNDANSDYLSDGITESIISNLSQLPQLRVMARSTVFHFKGNQADPREIGRQLGVKAVISGRLLRQGDELIVRTELINVADGTQLWGGEYDRELSNVLGLQQDISREISEKLRLKLTGEEKRRLTDRETTNAEAYEFYLRGRYFWNKRTGDGLTRAIEEFQQAIDRDPNYAQGYVGLADSYGLLEEYAGVPSSETLPKARAAVDHALAINDSLSEAHASSGIIFQQMWRWSETAEEYNRAVKLNPNYPTAHHFLSIYFRTQGQIDDSLREIKRAQELDPLSSVIGQNVAEIYLINNDLSSAMAQSKRIIELDPSFPGAHDELAFAYLKEKRNDEAMAEFQKIAATFVKEKDRIDFLTLSVDGRDETDARKIPAALEKAAALLRQKSWTQTINGWSAFEDLKDWRITTLPMHRIIGADGKLLVIHPEEPLEDILSAVLTK